MFVVATMLFVAVVVCVTVWPAMVGGGHRPVIARCLVVVLTVLSDRRVGIVAGGFVIRVVVHNNESFSQERTSRSMAFVASVTI